MVIDVKDERIMYCRLVHVFESIVMISVYTKYYKKNHQLTYK